MDNPRNSRRKTADDSPARERGRGQPGHVRDHDGHDQEHSREPCCDSKHAHDDHDHEGRDDRGGHDHHGHGLNHDGHHHGQSHRHDHGGHDHLGHGHHHGEHDHHGHGHHHGIGHHHGPDNKKGLLIAFLITAGIMLLEFFGGLFTRSLALMSDSAHMLSDAASLLLSLAAFWFAARPASSSKTYGFYRFEILAALFNAAALFVIAGFICWEAYGRFLNPPRIAGGSMMAIAAIGLAANLLSAWALTRQGDTRHNLNVRSAYLHVLGDALGSVGAILAGLIMLAFGWYYADPLISVIVALLILKSAWGVLCQAVHILMEGSPPTIDCRKVENTLKEIHGVLDVHDLHVWTITSGMDSLSCHLLIDDDGDSQEILQQAIRRIETVFRIQHTTIQIEKSRLKHAELKV